MVQVQSKWDEVNMRWSMPQMTIDRSRGVVGERIALPDAAPQRRANGLISDDALIDTRTDDKLREVGS